MTDQEFIIIQWRGLTDAIRWNEMLFFLGSLVVGYLLCRWWGVGIALIFCKMNTMAGGAMLSFKQYSSPTGIKIKPKCEILKCSICQKYRYKSKWWENII